MWYWNFLQAFYFKFIFIRLNRTSVVLKFNALIFVIYSLFCLNRTSVVLKCINPLIHSLNRFCLNRTSVVLKCMPVKFLLFLLCCLNRTSVVLKWWKISRCIWWWYFVWIEPVWYWNRLTAGTVSTAMISLNRTSVVLKCCCFYSLFFRLYLSLNRTSVVLKSLRRDILKRLFMFE